MYNIELYLKEDWHRAYEAYMDELKEPYEAGEHITKNGVHIRLEALSDEHLLNCIDFFKGTWRERYFLEELNKRKETEMGRSKKSEVSENESYRMTYLDLSKKPNVELKEYDVWIEGYAATGEHGTAQFLGKYKAESFAHACDIAMIDCGRLNPRIYRSSLGEGCWIKPNHDLYDMEKLTYWGCRLFDNEEDARKSFG